MPWTSAAPSRPAGPRVVLVHGIGMSGTSFLPLADKLAVDHDVYVLDLPGYGSTPQPARPPSVPELGEVVAAVIGALGLTAQREPVVTICAGDRSATCAPRATC